MHPDIADLPGTITYKWLACGPETEAPQDWATMALDSYMDTWWNGVRGCAENYQPWRRAPVFGKSPRENIRRLLFNVKGAKIWTS